MSARTLLERKKPLPNWADTTGIYADLSDYPRRVSYYVTCPKCHQTHGDFKDMREAHAKRVCPNCEIDAINKLKDYIAHVDDPDQRGKPPKSTTQMFHEAEEPPAPPPAEDFPEDNFDPMEMIHALADNWITQAITQLEAEQNVTLTPRDGEIPDAAETDKLELEGDDGTEWTVYKDESIAEAEALERVRDDLQSQPEVFTQTWLEQYIDLDRLKDYCLMDRDWRDEFVNSYGDEEEQIDYLIEQGLLEADDFITPTGRRRKLSPKRERMLEQAIEAWGERQAESFDPMEYMRDIYGAEKAGAEAIKAVGFNLDEAAKGAVNTDGWQHFMATYDGNSYNLESGAVAIRTN